MASKDLTMTCHRYCTAYLVCNGKPVTLAMTYVRSDEDDADTVEFFRCRQRRSIRKTELTSASKTLHDQFNLVYLY